MKGRSARICTKELGRTPLYVSADYAFSGDAVKLEASLGAEQDRLDLGMIADEAGMQVYSNRLLEETGYSVLFEGLMDTIDTSPFVPDSGTDYALTEELYEQIETFSEMLEREPQSFEETAKVIAKAFDAMLEKAETTEKKETLALIDGDAKANVYTYTFNKDALQAFVAELQTQWQENDAFCDEVSVYMDMLSDVQEDPEAWYTEQMKASTPLCRTSLLIA